MSMTSPLVELMRELARDVGDPAFLWQIAALGLVLLIAWWFSRQASGWFSERIKEAAVPGGLAFVEGGFARLWFPLSALALTLLARAVLEPLMHVHLLHLAVPLLVAFAAIRALVYLLRHALAPGGALAASERWIAIAIWVGVALYLSGLAPPILDAAEAARLPLGKHRISLLQVVQTMFAVALLLLIALWASALLERRLMSAESLDLSLRVVLGRFMRALMVLAAVLIALSVAGLDLTVLSVFGGALGVGLGLGLQKIASNYVSGFIILIDRSIRIGDLVTVDKYQGAVTHINTRYTVLKALDGTEAIVPNETLVNTPVLNQSFTTSENRLSVKLTVDYRSDVELVSRLLVEVAQAHPRVLHEPPPAVFLAQFGADGIELEMGFWISDPKAGSLNVRSDLNFSILKAFREHGVEIPYPQREVRLVGAAGAPAALQDAQEK
jgi:small-conductance mechanosensitive channel